MSRPNQLEYLINAALSQISKKKISLVCFISAKEVGLLAEYDYFSELDAFHFRAKLWFISVQNVDKMPIFSPRVNARQDKCARSKPQYHNTDCSN
jgi:hypothetical protein